MTFGCIVYKIYIMTFYKPSCVKRMPKSMQAAYTTIRVDLEVYNSLQSTRKILEQAYSRKFSLSETIQVINRLSSETIQRISSAKRELDEMLEGRGSASLKGIEHAIKAGERALKRESSE